MVELTSYVDTNVFIYWLGNHPSFGEVVHEWVKRIENGARGEYVTSSLTLYEVLAIIAGLTGRSLKGRIYGGGGYRIHNGPQRPNYRTTET